MWVVSAGSEGREERESGKTSHRRGSRRRRRNERTTNGERRTTNDERRTTKSFSALFVVASLSQCRRCRRRCRRCVAAVVTLLCHTSGKVKERHCVALVTAWSGGGGGGGGDEWWSDGGVGVIYLHDGGMGSTCVDTIMYVTTRRCCA